ncbi:MAG: DNA-3-methyladenine glycosylase [Puniceicoccales bacterium]|jgi:DNA-3-methyladenine glycosylase|nr:DNA-3-methyladenine glycosylase [Puniceicoccales bacterium]
MGVVSILDANFYGRDTLAVARELLGKILCKPRGNAILRGRIVETEVYTADDPASHSFRGRTKRTEAMFRKPGTAYIYLIYGMYHCLNITTERESSGRAVLIRALEGLDGLKGMNGPGKLCRTMGIDMDCNGWDITREYGKVWVEWAPSISVENIVQTTRIGIKKAMDRPWRFYISDNECVSRLK